MTTYNSRSRGPHTLFWTLRKLHSRVCRHMRVPLPEKSQLTGHPSSKGRMENEVFQTEHCHALLGCTEMSTGVGRPLEGAATVNTPQSVHGLFQAHLLSLTLLQSCRGAGRSQSHLQGAENFWGLSPPVLQFLKWVLGFWSPHPPPQQVTTYRAILPALAW